MLARSRPMVVAGPWPGSTSMSSGSGRTTVSQRAAHGGGVAAGQVVAADAAGEEHVAAQQRGGDAGAGPQVRPGTPGQVEQHRPLGVARGVPYADVEAGDLAACWPSASSTTSSGSAQVAARPNCCSSIATNAGVEAGERVDQPVPVVGVEVGRDAVGAADGRHRVGVVEVAVGQQDGGRPEPVLGEHLGELTEHLDARVDDQALLAGTGRDDVAVGPEDGGGEAVEQHAQEPIERAESTS